MQTNPYSYSDSWILLSAHCLYMWMLLGRLYLCVHVARELSRFIAAGRLHCKIDKVGGIVETSRPDSKNWQYQASYCTAVLLLGYYHCFSVISWFTDSCGCATVAGSFTSWFWVGRWSTHSHLQCWVKYFVKVFWVQVQVTNQKSI